MQVPFWLAIWQAAESILNVATEAALALPVMLLLCLILGRRTQRGAMARVGQMFYKLGLVTGVFAVLAVAGSGFVSLVALPSAMPSLEPQPFEPLALPWLATTYATIGDAAGVLMLVFCAMLASPVWRTAVADLDANTAQWMRRRATLAACFALVAFACMAASFMVRSWPFLGLPEQMTSETVFNVLAKHTWRTCCGALLPAGALAVLHFFLSLTPVSAEIKRQNRERRRAEVIPGTAEEVAPLSDEDKITLRMCTAFALAGAAFQFMDASYVAFHSMASMGSGLRMSIMRFGPFLVTAASIVCWAFIFARPRRHQLFLALLPVLLVFLRAAGRF